MDPGTILAIMEMAKIGYDVFTSVGSNITESENREITFKNGAIQALSDAATAGINADILNDQINAYATYKPNGDLDENNQNTLFGQKVQDINEQSAVASSDNTALAAASGMGSAGSNRARILSIGHRADRDIERFRASVNNQVSILEKQKAQQELQSNTFASQANNYLSQLGWGDVKDIVEASGGTMTPDTPHANPTFLELFGRTAHEVGNYIWDSGKKVGDDIWDFGKRTKNRVDKFGDKLWALTHRKWWEK